MVKRGGGSSALPNASVLSHRFTARLIDPTSLGAMRVTTGSSLRLDPVCKKLRRGQDIAQIMADSCDRAAQLRQPLLLSQQLVSSVCMRLQRMFGLAQFAHRRAGLNDPARVFGRCGIAFMACTTP